MNKKYAITFVLLSFLSISLFGQRVTIKEIESRLITNEGIEFVGELKDKSGDLYVFPTWKNYSILFINNKTYQISNLNFNIETNSFESRLNRDKLFSYKSSFIDSISISNHIFKKYGNIFYEVLYENNERVLLKKYDIVYQQGTEKRMGQGTEKSKALLKYNYLVFSDEGYEKIELNKRSIIGLFENNKTELESFVKKENLSYKKEKDIVIIFDFMIG